MQKVPEVDEIDEDLDEDDVDAKGAPSVDHESDDEIIESDVELEGEVLEPDNDPPQKVNKHKQFCSLLLFYYEYKHLCSVLLT